MSAPTTSPRRDFLKATGAAAAVAAAPLASARDHHLEDEGDGTKDEKKPVVGCIGVGDRWNAVGMAAARFGHIKTVCDVDTARIEKAVEMVKDAQGHEPGTTQDYREILDDLEIEVVTVVTPDHWHAQPLIEAVKAGKDVYCEKPMTLTIREGIDVCNAVEEAGVTVQVGTQQRTGMGQKFLTAVALVREGRLGTIEKITCGIDGAPSSGDIPAVDAPETLDWEKWLGQTPLVDFRFKDDGSRWGNSRAHYEFRWWYEYSGGKMTDWGAHHVDIAQWILDRNGPGQGPTKIVPVMDEVEHPAGMDESGMPELSDRYNAATKFLVKCEFPGAEIHISSSVRNGLLIEGTGGRIFVNRNSLDGQPVDDLAQNPLPDGALEAAYKNQPIPEGGGDGTVAHMRNFFMARAGEAETISDVFSHHRALTTCHLANIAIRLGRDLNWDPQAQQIVGDDRAQEMIAREPRDGYGYSVTA